MKMGLAVMVLAVLALGASTARADAKPYVCAGAPAEYVAAFDATDGVADGKVSYDEPRVWLEHQSWWEPQPANPGQPGHPGEGKQGHIHVNTCFPLYRTLSGATLHLDINVKLHNMPGRVPAKGIYVQGYGDFSYQTPYPTAKWECPAADCEQNVSTDVPLTLAQYSGWRIINVFALADNDPFTFTKVQRGADHWFVYLDNGKPAQPPNTGNTLTPFAEGDSWFHGLPDKYAKVGVKRTDLPWEDQTFAFQPKSGVWTFTVRFEKYEGYVFVDPKLHAVPPSEGMVAYHETVPVLARQVQVSVDTTQLADGVHKLLVGTCNVAPEGRHCGNLVIPFLVANGPCS